MKKILITGITGFAGSFLAEHLVSQHVGEIIGTYNSETSLKNVADIKDQLRLIKVDLTQQEAVESLIDQTQADEIYHLAALASPGKSFTNPAETVINNVTAEIYLLEAVRKHNLLPRMLIVSSAEIYGIVSPEDLPIDEQTPLRPVSPYAVSKIAQDYTGLQYQLSYKLPIIRVRPFNHIGPRQGKGLVVADFASQIAEIEKGEREPIIHVGNLEAKRDFTDVRDMVKAYALLMEKGEVGEVYNIGSGVSHKIQDILDMLLQNSTKEIHIQIDPARLRPSDIPEIISDNTKMHAVTGWQPTISLDQTLKDTLDYWRNIV